MSDANIDIEKFKAHSVRSASTNAAISMNIMKTAGWSREVLFQNITKNRYSMITILELDCWIKVNTE